MAYNPIKRLRAWFFQDNIPTETRTYTDGNGQTITKQVKTRMAKGHFPKEEVFKDLLQTTFLKSADNELQDVASNVEIESATNIEKVVKPNQLPELEADIAGGGAIADSSTMVDGFTGSVFEPKSRMNGSKKKWAYYFSTAFISWLFPKLVPKGGTTGQVLTKNSNAANDVRWQTLPSTSGVLPAGGTTNQYLRKINSTDYNTAWTNADWYTQAEVTTFLNTESFERSEQDALIINNNTAVVPDSFYADHNLDLFKTRLDAIDVTNGTQTTNISTNTGNISNIIGGATLPTSNLANLQTQINALNSVSSFSTKTLLNPTNAIFVTNSNNIGVGFTKVGNMVFIDGYITINTNTSVAGMGVILYSNNAPVSIRPISTSYRSINGISTTGTVSQAVRLTIYNNGEIYLQKFFEASPVDYTTSETISFSACYFVD